MSVTKEETKKSATNVQDGDFNPNNLVKFVDFKAPRVSVFTTVNVIAHYPKVGTEVALEKNKAAKWIEKGWAGETVEKAKAVKAKKKEVADA